ncbi:MAG TPA: hypothetical protein VFP72_15950, partial [Kineosporiaceae bacterium]|nr:hypothetical protein [Kineosporiaceae bacterium]
GILARSVYYVADALIDAVFPFIARARGTAGSHAWFVAAARWFPLGLLPVQAVLLLAPAPVLALLFPSAYADAAGLLRVLDLGTVGLIGAGMLVKALYANDAAVTVAPRTALAAVVEVTALAALVPAAGAAGAAWAYTLGSWTAAVLLGVAYLRLQDAARPLSAVRGGATARYLLCLAGCGTVLTVAQHQPGPLGGALIIGALGLFGALAATTRLLSAQDLRRIRQVGAAVTGAARRTVRSAGRLLAGRAR